MQASKLARAGRTRLVQTSYKFSHLLGHFLILPFGLLIGSLIIMVETWGKPEKPGTNNTPGQIIMVKQVEEIVKAPIYLNVRYNPESY